MIPELLLLALAARAEPEVEAPHPVARAEEARAPEAPAEQLQAVEAPAEEVPADDVLSPYRAPFGPLAERAIGTTSRPVAFDWRRTDAQVAVVGSYLAELNNFNSMSAGLMLRLPSDKALVEIGVRGTSVWDSPSSRMLAFTPYRQPGRPSRLDVDVALGLPLAEGIVTAATKYFPAVQLVFNGYVGLRYSLYPTGFREMTAGQVMRAVLAPRLTDAELLNLEDARLDAMKLDRARYTPMLGVGNDIYFKSGLFLSPRVQVAVPLLAPATETELYVWTDVSIAAGYAW